LRHVPKQPREGINVSDTHPLVEAGTLVAGLTLIFVLVVLLLVFLVEVVLFFVPADKEAALFRDWLPDDLIAVSPANERLHLAQQLVDRLAFHWGDSPYDFRIEIQNSREPNALALPGGLIIITEGLLDQVESENELAFVLGHELGHFRNRDHIRALGRGIALSLFYAVTTGTDISGLGIKVSDVALSRFSRRQELAADEFGLTITYTHYGHVDEAWRLFERWDSGDGAPLIDLADYASTHPQPRDRIEKLQQLALEHGWPIDGTITSLGW
jgi:Zn-dependent protease with chaperone function